jgi:hypothetical protein
MKPRTMLCGVAIVACLAFAIPMQDTRQDTRQDESAKKIEILARALEVEKRRTTDLEKRLDRIDLWFRSMRSAAELLDGAANEARRNGFEQAGPNALSRLNVLEGMKGFAAEISRTIPVPLDSAPR